MNRTHISSADRLISATLVPAAEATELPLLVCIHGGGCNGNYFELRGNSTVAAATGRGFDVLVLNRPGYAGNDVPASISPIADTAPLIRGFIDQVRAEHSLLSRGVAIIGHSIGGAIAIKIAAKRAAWPLRAIAISGIGDVSPPMIRKLKLPDDVTHIQPPPELTEGLFHDPERILSWKSVASLRAAAEPWLVTEVKEVVQRWPAEWRAEAERVDVPVFLRLAENERIWESGENVVDRMAAAFSSAPVVDSGLLPEGGHLYEATAHGPALIGSQLDFIERHAR